MALHHRPHRAIQDDDALAKKSFERMKGDGMHGEATINDAAPRSATNKLMHHDASICLFFLLLLLEHKRPWLEELPFLFSPKLW
jgi:hypothetical protein